VLGCLLRLWLPPPIWDPLPIDSSSGRTITAPMAGWVDQRWGFLARRPSSAHPSTRPRPEAATAGMLNRQHRPVLSASGQHAIVVDPPLQDVLILSLPSPMPIGTSSSKESTSRIRNCRYHACLSRCRPPHPLTVPLSKLSPVFSRPC
jgi:hypothetical protein